MTQPLTLEVGEFWDCYSCSTLWEMGKLQHWQGIFISFQSMKHRYRNSKFLSRYLSCIFCSPFSVDDIIIFAYNFSSKLAVQVSCNWVNFEKKLDFHFVSCCAMFIHCVLPLLWYSNQCALMNTACFHVHFMFARTSHFASWESTWPELPFRQWGKVCSTSESIFQRAQQFAR